MRGSDLAQQALNACPRLLFTILPNGAILNNREFLIGSINGEKGQSLRFNWVKGVGTDFATGVVFPSIFHLVAAVRGISLKAAVKLVAEMLDMGFYNSNTVYTRINRQAKDHKIQIIIPAPKLCSEIQRIRPDHVYPYQDLEGNLVFYIFRFNNPKRFLPIIYTAKGWVYKFPPKPRPIYNGQLLKLFPDAKVIIVEGEKACEAASILLPTPEYLCLTWSAGAYSIRNTDWSGLLNRNIIIWPDNDRAGVNAGLNLKSHLLFCKISKSISVVRLIETRKSGWDAADAKAEGWDRDKVEKLLKMVW